jgi:hypothetical protein
MKLGFLTGTKRAGLDARRFPDTDKEAERAIGRDATQDRAV